MILDSYFLIPNDRRQSTGELPFLRGFFDVLHRLGDGDLFRTQLIPGFYNVFGLLIPDRLQTFYFSPGPAPTPTARA